MSEETRTATFETRHADAATAATVATALAPDNTQEMHTEADGDIVRTRIERETTGGLHASADDYLVNVSVADTVVANARVRTTDDVSDTGDNEAGSETGDDGIDDSSDNSDISDTNDTNETYE